MKRSENWSQPIPSIGLGKKAITTVIAVQIVSNLPAPAMGTRFTVFEGKPAMQTRWLAGAAPHKSG